jgi:nitrite reductase/ring-hydroxylating ferredoxin subunit
MKRLLIYLFAFLSAGACDKTYVSSIPDYLVYLELDLSFEDNALVAVQGYRIYTQENINSAIESAGFGGVLVYHGISSAGADAYYAFDAACPVEASRSVTIEIDSTGVQAVCPKCQSRYELFYGLGAPVSGPGKEQLRRYNVTVSGNKVYVRN